MARRVFVLTVRRERDLMPGSSPMWVSTSRARLDQALHAYADENWDRHTLHLLRPGWRHLVMVYFKDLAKDESYEIQEAVLLDEEPADPGEEASGG
jgi:hypothetical protein